MLWTLLASFALLTGNPEAPAAKPSLKTAAVSASQPSPQLVSASYNSPIEDPEAEADLLALANQNRKRAGLPPLRMNESLTEAARQHARLMVESGQLSHQFDGEPALLTRIAQVGDVRLDNAGENVAYNSSAGGTDGALMRSPPHRRNLLDPAFNIAGIAAIWDEGRLYVVQDFGHEVPSVSAQQIGESVGSAVHALRQHAGLFDPPQVFRPGLDDAVCAMAQNGRMDAGAIRSLDKNGAVIAYTQSQPAVLPAGVEHAVTEAKGRQFSVGSCYSRNTSAPTGMYWVVILVD